MAASGVRQGLRTLFCRHTSASLTIQENADPDVLRDLQDWFARAAPENESWMRHTTEGPDDMPAHIKSALTGVSLQIPITNARLALGTWQGVYAPFIFRGFSIRGPLILLVGRVNLHAYGRAGTKAKIGWPRKTPRE